MNQKITYKDAGVNINLGNEASKILYNASKLTWQNRKGKFGEATSTQNIFSGLRFLDFKNIPKEVKFSLNSDGIGTKVEIAERMKDHSTMAFDLIAMVVDDAVVRGGIPISLATVLDVNSLNRDKNAFKYLKQLALGYTMAANEAGITVLNGEIAELPERIFGYGDFNYNWSSTLLWVSTEDKLIDGSKIEVGASVVLLREKGFRSNGISLLRKVMKTSFGENWHKKTVDGINLGKEALTPSTIYCKSIIAMIGDLNEKPKCNIQAISHITGGGIPEKLKRVLKAVNCGIELNNLYQPNSLMLKCQNLAKTTDEQAYKIWNMGQGMVIISNEPKKVIKIAKDYNIDAKIGGKVVSHPKIKIKSKGLLKRDRWIEFPT